VVQEGGRGKVCVLACWDLLQVVLWESQQGDRTMPTMGHNANFNEGLTTVTHEYF
jgi:hypothetical protein